MSQSPSPCDSGVNAAPPEQSIHSYMPVSGLIGGQHWNAAQGGGANVCGGFVSAADASVFDAPIAAGHDLKVFEQHRQRGALLPEPILHHSNGTWHTRAGTVSATAQRTTAAQQQMKVRFYLIPPPGLGM